jgi:DNA (cytosine-5)-methyltransferase 1
MTPHPFLLDPMGAQETDDLLVCTQQFTQPKVEPLDDEFYADINETMSPEVERAMCEALDKAERRKTKTSTASKTVVKMQTPVAASVVVAKAISFSPEFELPPEDELAMCKALDALTGQKPKRPLMLAAIDQQENSDPAKNAKQRRSTGASLPTKKNLKDHFTNSSTCHTSKDSPGYMIEWCSIRVNLFDRRYKKGEVWTCNVGKNSAVLKGYFFKIAGFGISARRNAAVCPPGNVLVDLGHTFIGEEEAARLKAARPSEFGKALVCGDTSTMLSDRKIQLAQLDQEETDFDTSSNWEYSLLNDTLSAGYNCAYKNRDAKFERVSEMRTERKPVCLELFAGAGGMSHGLVDAGFDVKYAVEIDSFAAATLQVNHPGMIVFEEDVTVFLEKAEGGDPCYPKPGDIDHIHASPPCQGFSLANRNGGVNDTKNNNLTFRLIGSVRRYFPPTVSMENVNGILMDDTQKIKASTQLGNILQAPTTMKQRKHYIQVVTSDFMELGYQVRIIILDASHYGDAQSRERVILFAAHWAWKLPDMPPPTHGTVDTGLKAFVTAQDVLHDLENVQPVRGSGLVMLPDGRTIVTDHNEEGTKVKSEYQQLIAEGTTPTVRKSNSLLHYAHHRDLTVRERARLQSFPDTHIFCGSLKNRSDQIGNAVPVNLARAIAKSVMGVFTLKKI